MNEIVKHRALCVLDGGLAVGEFSVSGDKSIGCPFCRKNNFIEHHDWTWCSNCGGFAVLTSDLVKIKAPAEAGK